MQFVKWLDEIRPDDLVHVGGKALSLAVLRRAGLPVPDGFVLVTAAHQQREVCRDRAWDELRAAYAALGSPIVAVRSSAVSEDGEAASFAGQQETILGVQGSQDVIAAVEKCWASFQGERVAAYRARTGGSETDGMAVVIQRLVPAECAGVLFTVDPTDPTGRHALVEAAPGLGDQVVSGAVTPERFRLPRTDGSTPGDDPRVEVTSACPGETALPTDLIDAETAQRLADLGRRIEELYGSPRDVEWACAGGQIWLLQARPITTISAQEREDRRQEEIAVLRQRADRRGTAWARYNLAESLPEPTPMTWAVVRQFMSGRGGYGMMLRDLGFDPDPILDDDGFMDLVCGRPYVNLGREPKLYFRDFPTGYDLATLKKEPSRALYPTPQPLPELVTARFVLRLPVLVWRMLRNYSLMQRQMLDFAERLRIDVYPRFLADVAQAEAEALDQMDEPALLSRLDDWRRRTLLDFARQALRPSVFAGLALARLEQALCQPLGAERASHAVRTLLTGVRPDPEVDLAAAIQQLRAGALSRDAFLRDFGHRGRLEMELAQPRWREAPEELCGMEVGEPAPPGEAEDLAMRWARVRDEARLPSKSAERLAESLRHAWAYLGLREASKHHLLRGYAVLRATFLELDRRGRLDGGIFYLLPEELPRLVRGDDLSATIKRRRRERTIALSLEVPTVLFSDDLDAIGRPVAVASVRAWQGTGISAGVAEGEALVLQEPRVPNASVSQYVLVCPSTDPAWVPLFLKARGLVMETGGILSHGAIVAREFALPAVAGLPGICQQVKTGQRIHVDGNSGRVSLVS